jgi:ribosomal protein L25 (general stress protein Ctc)
MTSTPWEKHLGACKWCREHPVEPCKIGIKRIKESGVGTVESVSAQGGVQAMTYTEHADGVTLQMTHDDFATLLLALGYAHLATIRSGAGAASDRSSFWRWIEFANRLNATNPNFTQYEIPPKKGKPR